MKKLIGWLLCLVLAAPLPMFSQEVIRGRRRAAAASPTITVGTGKANACSSTATCTVTGMTTSAGQDLVVGIAMNGSARTVTSVTLSDGTTTCPADTALMTVSTRMAGFYRCHNIPGSITGVTVVVSPSTDWGIVATPVNNLSGIDVADTTGVQNTNTTPVSGPMTTTNAKSIVFGMYYDANGNLSYSQNGSWLISDQKVSALAGDVAMVYQIMTSTGTYTPTTTLSGSAAWIGLGISYHP